MLSDTDKRMVEIVAARFQEDIESEKTGNPLVAYGREILNIEDNTPVAGIWWGYFIGFGSGIESTAEDENRD